MICTAHKTFIGLSEQGG